MQGIMPDRRRSGRPRG